MHNFLLLRVDKNLVPFDFSCSIPRLDENQVMIDQLAINNSNGKISICVNCYKALDNDRQPRKRLPISDGSAMFLQSRVGVRSDRVGFIPLSRSNRQISVSESSETNPGI